MKKILLILLVLINYKSFGRPVIGGGGGGMSLLTERHSSMIDNEDFSSFSNVGPSVNVILSDLVLERNVVEERNITRLFENLDNGNRINISNYRSYLNPSIE